MSNALFPTLAGLTWTRSRAAQINSLMQKTVSGMASAVQLQTYPTYKYTLNYDMLRSGAAFLEWQNLLGFFNQRGGVVDTFLFNDWEDNAVTAQALGTGNGSTKTFQLYRTLGGFTEPVLAQNVVSAVYLNGVAQPTGWTVSNAIISFTSAPGHGVAVTADFSFYWRCRFSADTISADTLWYQFWEMKKIELDTALFGSG